MQTEGRLEDLSLLDSAGNKGDTSSDKCSGRLSAVDAFLYGLPAGIFMSGILLVIFILFGNSITGRNVRKEQASASSNTRANRRDILGKKNKRGPPPSVDLRPVDMNQMALREDAPDDIRAMALAGKLSKIKVPSKQSI